MAAALALVGSSKALYAIEPLVPEPHNASTAGKPKGERRAASAAPASASAAAAVAGGSRAESVTLATSQLLPTLLLLWVETKGTSGRHSVLPGAADDVGRTA